MEPFSIVPGERAGSDLKGKTEELQPWTGRAVDTPGGEECGQPESGQQRINGVDEEEAPGRQQQHHVLPAMLCQDQNQAT